MPASLASLSPELIDIIVWNLFILDIDASLAPYATISHPFQVAVERITFGRVYVPSGSHQQLCEIGAHPWRKRSLRSLAYDIDLPRYPTSRRYKKERRKEHEANLVAFHEGLTTLWNELSTWKDKTPTIELHLLVESKTDQFEDEVFGRESQEYRWLYPNHSLTIDSERVTLPTLDCASSFMVSGGRRIHPTALKDIFLTLPNLRELNLTLPPVLARYKASWAEYRADLAKALEAPTLQKLEVLALSMQDSAPENHDYNIALSEDPSYPNGDVLSHTIRKLAQRSLQVLIMGGSCVISPALWSTGQGVTEFPYLTELDVDMTITTYDGRWYYTGDPAATAPTELDPMDEFEMAADVESESESTNPEMYDREIDEVRAAFFNGNIPYLWRQNPDPEMYNPLVRSLVEATLGMPQLKYLSVTTKGGPEYIHGRDVEIQLHSPEFAEMNLPDLEGATGERKKWTWSIELDREVSWDLPADIQETMKKRVGEDGQILIHTDGKVLHQM
ncbi:uncharacterized protein APUU_80057S [Aspergillus puulaauensis]|uniref:F-box domain-containing protein n=1 Tax=Aspergillus puulaauensis TaxID=1220207 RepID=A0A7R8ARV0_9EURO|nr:uncharacterized protein APUU_80057S [Aspergillus puulaauensis]BCS29754.1 hypothetical protein APUU_80057S [Aspergillus puulaauensis]